MTPHCILAAVVCGAVSEDIDVSLPERVDVLPVFFVPKGEPLPTREQNEKLMKHLRWAQDWYRMDLGGRDTFRIAKAMPDVHRAKGTLTFYKQQAASESRDASHFVGELLDHYGVNRFNCPYCFAIFVMNPREDYPIGGGRPLNGGFNRGGGMLQMSSYCLDKAPNFQSTLRHELAHSFGLPHVEVYGYDMNTNPSVMAYNPGHHTVGFQDSATPARFIPEDLRALPLNQRCFAKLKYDPDRDNPSGQKLHRVVWLGPMDIVGQPSYNVDVTTGSGALYGTQPVNVVQRRIDPNKGPGIGFNAASMWHSEVSESGWVSLNLTFPVPVTLTKMGIYSQHSGQYHAADRARIQVEDGEEYRDVAEQDLKSADAIVSMPPTRGVKWRLHLRAGRSKIVVVRGLRFSGESGEVFPPAVPYTAP